MNGSWTEALKKRFKNKEFRDAYVEEDLRTGIAFQIRLLRESQGLSQADLGRKAGKAQSAVARLENPDYGRFSLSTLLGLASAFDVALLVRFVSFSELLSRNQDLSPQRVLVPQFDQDFGTSSGEGLAQVFTGYSKTETSASARVRAQGIDSKSGTSSSFRSYDLQNVA